MKIPLPGGGTPARRDGPAPERRDGPAPERRGGPDPKREPLLSAAARVFGRDGIDAPMSRVAHEAGIGVASVYRRFASKQELLAALVVRRQMQIEAAARAAAGVPSDRWSALTGMLRELAHGQWSGDFLGDARVAVGDHPDVLAATARAGAALEEVLDAARREGRLRPDATILDVRLLLAGTRIARRVDEHRWPRMLELMIDALDTQRDQ